MHLIIHIAFGLFLLGIFNNPLVLFLAIFIGHFLLDSIPHYKPLKRIFIETIIDILLSIIFIFFYLVFGTGHSSVWIFSGAIFFAILPDMFLLIDWLWKVKIIKPFMLDFHRKIQHEYQWGWIIELGLLFYLLFFLF
ncbi:hypothetical protein KKC63_01615 [Patescibacteria group bacterium]|nr:hypothetical protein [Patescibacteria group bacterium]MBU4023256.1 hypothetical protein [Patescibacteria group bacterium]MBU4078066.1 hypothetical protein [Patescibacteria group bacterium]